MSYYVLLNQSLFKVHRSVSQIPQCTRPISHNAPFITEMCTCVYISVTKWCTVGYLFEALRDLWNGAIALLGQTSVIQLITEAEWPIYAPINYTINGSDNGLSPIGAEQLSEPMTTYHHLPPLEQTSVICNLHKLAFSLKNAFENAICKILSMLFIPQCFISLALVTPYNLVNITITWTNVDLSPVWSSDINMSQIPDTSLFFWR